MPYYAQVDEDDVPVGVLKWLDKYTDITTLDTESEPTLAEATTTIDQVEAEVNGVLKAAGYETVPATGPASINLLRMYVETEAAYKIYTQIYGVNELPPVIRSWHVDYREFLARLRRGEQYLPDQSPKSATGVGSFNIRVLENEDDE